MGGRRGAARLARGEGRKAVKRRRRGRTEEAPALSRGPTAQRPQTSLSIATRTLVIAYQVRAAAPGWLRQNVRSALSRLVHPPDRPAAAGLCSTPFLASIHRPGHAAPAQPATFRPPRSTSRNRRLPPPLSAIQPGEVTAFSPVLDVQPTSGRIRPSSLVERYGCVGGYSRWHLPWQSGSLSAGSRCPPKPCLDRSPR